MPCHTSASAAPTPIAAAGTSTVFLFLSRGERLLLRYRRAVLLLCHTNTSETEFRTGLGPTAHCRGGERSIGRRGTGVTLGTPLAPAAGAEVLHGGRAVLAGAAVEAAVLTDGIGKLVVEVVGIHFIVVERLLRHRLGLMIERRKRRLRVGLNVNSLRRRRRFCRN